MSAAAEILRLQLNDVGRTSHSMMLVPMAHSPESKMKAYIKIFRRFRPSLLFWCLMIAAVIIANDAIRDSNVSLSHFKNLVRPVSDKPGDVDPDCPIPLLRDHYFGDFQTQY